MDGKEILPPELQNNLKYFPAKKQTKEQFVETINEIVDAGAQKPDKLETLAGLGGSLKIGDLALPPPTFE